GPVPVALTWRSDELSFAWMTQPLPVFSAPSTTAAEAAAALALPEAAVARTGLPVQDVSCGVPFLVVPLTTRTAVDSTAIDAAGYSALMRAGPEAGSGVFCFSPERTGDNATVYSRMFAPAVGVFEDAATGIASGPLGCYLVRHNVVTSDQAASMISLQGVRMG